MKANLNNPLSIKGLPAINFDKEVLFEQNKINLFTKKILRNLKKDCIKYKSIYVKDLNNVIAEN